MTVVNDSRVPGTWLPGWRPQGNGPMGRGGGPLQLPTGWGGPQRVQPAGPVGGTKMPPGQWGGMLQQGRFQGGGRPIGFMGGTQSPWNDPRRMARDPRLQRGTHPQQQSSPWLYGSNLPNYERGPVSPRLDFAQRLRGIGQQQQQQQPTAPRTMMRYGAERFR